MKKHFISANDLLHDSFLLAEKVYLSGFRPDFIVGVWRGGAPVGIAVQEFFDFIGIKTNHIAIRTSSYTGIDMQSSNVKVFGLNYVLDNISSSTSLLIVDDVFDSGKSVSAILSELEKKGALEPPPTIKIACPWFKPERNKTDLTPDYYVHTTDDWLVFPHEIVGLDNAEIRQGKSNKIADILLKYSPT